MNLGSDPETSILVIDDDQNILKVLSRILSPRYSVTTVGSIQQAHQEIISQEFGLVIIDYQLRDDVDGITFAKYVKTRAPLTFTLMLTGNSNFHLIQRALNEGNIDKFVVKPFDSHELLEIADSALANYSSKQEISEMLQSSDGIKIAQNLLVQVFDEVDEQEGLKVDLSGVVISHNSIPVYSKFLNRSYLKKFTDTIFSGFMTAINMVGQEVFNDDTKVDILRFGQVSILFKFYESYQFCFIIRHKGDNPTPSHFKFFDTFVEDIVSELKDDTNFFNYDKDYIEILDSKLDQIRNSVTIS